MSPDAVVVGAGVSGLACAIELATSRRVLVVDRVPVAGGELGWQSSYVRELCRRAERCGVRLRLGATALRWCGRRLLLASPGTVEWIPSDVLVFAGGVRPETATDLGIVGDRPAGVLPATVAEHLLASGQKLWDRVCIVGDGRWGVNLSHRLHENGTMVHALVPSTAAPVWADHATTFNRGLDTLRVEGAHRVEALVVDGGRTTRIPCNAVILAGDGLPNRNVEGALREGALDVVFVQPTADRSGEDRASVAAGLVREWVQHHPAAPSTDQLATAHGRR